MCGTSLPGVWWSVTIVFTPRLRRLSTSRAAEMPLSTVSTSDSEGQAERSLAIAASVSP